MNKKKGSGVRGSLRVIIALFRFRPISHISIYVYYRMKAKKKIGNVRIANLSFLSFPSV